MTPTSEAMSDVREYLQMKHTTGPWAFGHLGSHRLWIGKSHNHLPVATVAWDCDDAHDNAKENARLIAAAPVMLAALREIEEMADDRADADDGIPNEAMRMLVIVRDAIAKAEGKS